MNLTKVMRKNSRTLLMIFMSLLLVVFLLPDTSMTGNTGCAGREQVGVVYGRAVYLDEVQQVDRNVRVANELGLALSPYPRGIEFTEAFLLVTEAREAGVRIGREQVRDMIQESGIRAERLQEVQQRYRLSSSALLDALADVMAVRYLFTSQVDVVGSTRPRLERTYRDQFQRADLQNSVIMASGLVHQVGTPTEEDLQALFEAGKDRETAHTDAELVFGYRESDRVQLEYLTIDPAAILDFVKVRESEAQRFYEENRARYVRRQPKPAEAGQEGPQFDEIPLSYEEVRDRVRDDCRAEKAVLEAQRLMNDIAREARRPWTASGTDAQGFAQPPAEAGPSFTDLRDRFSDTLPVEYGRTEWLSRNTLMMQFPLIGRATFALTPQQSMTATELAFRVKGLYTPVPEDTRPMLALNEPGPLVFQRAIDPRTRRQGPPRQAVLFRVVDVRPAGPPESLAVVRAAVERDWKLMQAFELAQRQGEALAARAREVGLEQAVAEADALRALLTQPPPPLPDGTPSTQPTPETQRNLAALGPAAATAFTRAQPQIREVGPVPQLAEQVFALGDPAALAPAERILVTALPQRQMVVVSEVRGVQALYAEQLNRERGALDDDEFYDFNIVLGAWYDAEHIHQRTGWQPRELR
jgi:hypothetical protein